MAGKPKDEILHDHNHDGIDRRGFLKCMAWAGTGAFCVMQGGVLKSYSLSGLAGRSATSRSKASSASCRSATATWDSTSRRITDVAGTLKAAIDKINALADAA